jgi:hypothetical protein
VLVEVQVVETNPTGRDSIGQAVVFVGIWRASPTRADECVAPPTLTSVWRLNSNGILNSNRCEVAISAPQLTDTPDSRLRAIASSWVHHEAPSRGPQLRFLGEPLRYALLRRSRANSHPSCGSLIE